MSVHNDFMRHFRSLEAALNIEGKLTDDPVRNFEILTEMTADNSRLALLVQNYGITRIRFLRHSCSNFSTREKMTTNLSSYVTDLIFHSLVASIGFKYPKNEEPKIHHWLPVSYTRNFVTTRRVRDFSEKKRSCFIRSITFTNDGDPIEREISDMHFAHGVDSSGHGFYNLTVEHFFARIESMLAEARGKLFEPKLSKRSNSKDIFTHVAIASFFIVQSVRNPHPSSAQFSIRTLGGVVQGLIAALDEIPQMFVTMTRTNQHLGFTPYVPTRIRILANGTRAMIFPVSIQAALIITDRPRDTWDPQRVAESTNRALISHARRTGSTVFGIGHDDIHSGR